METMGSRIKRLRLMKNMTQEELGEKVGLKRAAINKYEKGNVENMKRSIILKMSEVLNVSPNYLMALRDDGEVHLEIKKLSDNKELNKWLYDMINHKPEELMKLKQMWEVMNSK
ncbi:helix-turn-helix transcriptional regulator [Listeria booriae]|uniref:Helix-turn-helix transcriptional regulator n=1 Tax=Listeria booriae TaxID=1552123 RepID=A0A841YN30_9LIST|nr:helix-turn-helix transcriptional regulator [Listeria booriae]MBC1402102.1 helix-turn-helix transcriptional regulator [Listeria booriae]MBC1617834.1 helix-turn-helix transcriptional regulator [Listeria booriae]